MATEINPEGSLPQSTGLQPGAPEGRSYGAGVEKNREEERSPSVFLMAILLILAIILVYQTNVKPTQANYACTRAIIAGRAGNVQRTIEKYQQALNYKTPQGSYEIRHKLATFTIQFTENQRQKNKSFDPSLLYYSIKEVSKNIETDPLSTIPYLYLGRLYILLVGKESKTAGEQAEEAIRRAIEINPKNPRIWYELGQAQLSQKKYQESYKSFERALELNPDVATSWWFVGISAYQAGNYDGAVRAVEEAMRLGYSSYKNSIVDLMRLVNIYEKAGQYQKVVETYELAIKEQPENPQLYASLAAAYAKVGNYDKAAEMARKAAAIDPKFQDDSEKFIKSLGL